MVLPPKQINEHGKHILISFLSVTFVHTYIGYVYMENLHYDLDSEL